MNSLNARTFATLRASKQNDEAGVKLHKRKEMVMYNGFHDIPFTGTYLKQAQEFKKTNNVDKAVLEKTQYAPHEPSQYKNLLQ